MSYHSILVIFVSAAHSTLLVSVLKFCHKCLEIFEPALPAEAHSLQLGLAAEHILLHETHILFKERLRARVILVSDHLNSCIFHIHIALLIKS